MTLSYFSPVEALCVSLLFFVIYCNSSYEPPGFGTDYYNFYEAFQETDDPRSSTEFVATFSHLLTGDPSPLYFALVKAIACITEQPCQKCLVLVSTLSITACIFLLHLTCTIILETDHQLSLLSRYQKRFSKLFIVAMFAFSSFVWRAATSVGPYALQCFLFCLLLFFSIWPGMKPIRKVQVLTFLTGLAYCTYPRWSFTLLCPLIFVCWEILQLCHQHQSTILPSCFMCQPISFSVGLLCPYMCSTLIMKISFYVELTRSNDRSLLDTFFMDMLEGNHSVVSESWNFILNAFCDIHKRTTTVSTLTSNHHHIFSYVSLHTSFSHLIQKLSESLVTACGFTFQVRVISTLCLL